MSSQDENYDDLFKKIEEFLSDSSNQETHEKPVGSIMDKEEFFVEHIEPLLKRIGQLCNEHEIPIILSAITKIQEDGGMNSRNMVVMPFSVCEFKAIMAILDMPHDFSHSVIKQAVLFQTMMDLMNDDEDKNASK